MLFRSDHNHDEKRRAATNVQARETARMLGRERQAVLEAMDGLVLGAVIAEHALDIFHAPDKPDVEHEDDDAQYTVDDVPGQRVAVVLANDKVRDERRRHDEQHIRVQDLRLPE